MIKFDIPLLKTDLSLKAKEIKRVLSAFFIMLILLTHGGIYTYSNEQLDKYQEEKKQKEEELEEKEKVLEEVQEELDAISDSNISISQKIAIVTGKINETTARITESEETIKKKEETLVEKQKQLEEKQGKLSKAATGLYKNSRISMFEMIFQRSELDSVFKILNYRKYAVDDHLQQVHSITNEYLVIQDEKKKIEREKRLLAVRKDAYLQSQKALQAEKKKIEAEMAAKRDMENQLEDEIDSLATDISSLQRKIIEVRSGMFVVDIESVPDTGDYDATLAGFMDNAPSGSFAVFSFGAYTHRNGMSQYGTLGRVEGGQNYQQVLQHYYGKSPEKKDTSGEIKVKDEGEMDFETDYMYGIGEMPSYWPVEALKVQAVAARSYAYRYYDSGLKICKTESCQVWIESKSEDPPDNWKKAVDATKGMIVEDVVGQYSAATGGYLNDSGWDTTDGSHSGDWPARAWESKAGCPWFYKAWYRKGYSDSSDSCGRKPWLSEKEMADIVNAWLILEEVDVKGDPDTDKILPVTIDDCEIGGVDDDDAYSMDELKTFINNPVTQINGRPVVVNTDSGETDRIIFDTNRGRVEIDGDAFKATFNIRAPGYIAIPQAGFIHINIEKK